jgi:tryptophanyl-tRNA synthetase
MNQYTFSQQSAIERSRILQGRILAQPSAFRILTGDRPTGALHIGHYFGSLLNRVQLQNLGVELIVLIADYQVLTDREASQRLPEAVRGLLADYLAVGIDPDRSIIFTHSALSQLNELMLPFLSLVTDAELRRNPTVKAEIELSGRGPSGLMMTYPVHQAADILFCHATVVPVGLDQLPHIELTRLIARRFNERYGETFVLPDALLARTPLLPGLDGRKMSKSRGNTIELQASAEQTAAIIRRAPTDDRRQITYEPVRRPQVAVLLELLAAVTGDDPAMIAQEIGGGGAAVLKGQLTEAVNELLAPVRLRRREVCADPAELDRILDAGNARARAIAAQTLRVVHTALGMRYADRPEPTRQRSERRSRPEVSGALGSAHDLVE